MTALQSIKKALEPIGLYDTESHNLNAELRAYADELDRLDAQLDAILPERFISTASGEGLSVREEYFGPVRSDKTVAERRLMLSRRLSLGGSDFTLAGIRQALDSFGLEYVISEFPSNYHLNIVAQTEHSRAEQRFITREVSKIIPAHIEWQLLFNTATWSELDARDKTFAQLDADDLTWDDIDSIT